MPKQNFAEVSGNGHGVVYTEGGTYLIETGSNRRLKPENAKGVNLSMWLQGGMYGETVDVGDFPFEAAYDALDAVVRRERTLDNAIRIIVGTGEFVAFIDASDIKRSPELVAPKTHRREELTLWRDGECISKAVCTEVDPRSPCEVFLGFEGISPELYYKVLKPEQFQHGDEIHIKTIKCSMTPAQFWEDMTSA